MTCSCEHDRLSVPIFKSCLNNQCQVLSWSPFSDISLRNCPCIYFSLQFCPFCFLNSPLVTASSVLIFSAVATPLMRFFFRIGNIKAQTIFLFSNARTHTYQASVSSFLFMYSLFTSPLWCNALYIVTAGILGPALSYRVMVAK